MSDKFVVDDMFQSEFSSSRAVSVPLGSSKAQVTFALAEVEPFDDKLRMASKLEVKFSVTDADEPFCEVLSELVLVLSLREGAFAEDWTQDATLEEVNDFTLRQTYALHRQRVLQATTQMELPTIRLPYDVDSRFVESLSAGK
jgi:hypothetical protein